MVEGYVCGEKLGPRTLIIALVVVVVVVARSSCLPTVGIQGDKYISYYNFLAHHVIFLLVHGSVSIIEVKVVFAAPLCRPLS